MPKRAVPVTLLLLLTPVLSFGQAPRGPEFPVNVFTTGGQASPTVAWLPDGGFVVAWEGAGESDGNGVFARRFGPTGVPPALNSTRWGAWGEAGHSPAMFVQDDSPRDEDRYRARFFLDPGTFDPGEAEGHRRARIFIAFEEAPSRRLAAVVLRRVNGDYSLLARARLDDGSRHDTATIPITADAHFVEIDWKRSSGPSANDGTFQVWLDGRSVHAATALDNSISSVDFVRLGALSVKSGASGTLIWDDFESRRGTHIGP